MTSSKKSEIMQKNSVSITNEESKDKDKSLKQSIKVIRHVVEENNRLNRDIVDKTAHQEETAYVLQVVKKTAFELEEDNRKLKTELNLLQTKNDHCNTIEREFLEVMESLGNSLTEEEKETIRQRRKKESIMILDDFSKKISRNINL